ncbi:hypothetical protein D3C77_723960 [compost metagenome]
MAGLVQAEDADMRHMVVGAGIDAAGDIEFQFADVLLPGRVETQGDVLGNRH